MSIVTSKPEYATHGEERWMHPTQTAAAGRPVAGRASARSVDSGAYVKQAEHADGTGRLGAGGDGRGGTEVRLLRLGRAE